MRIDSTAIHQTYESIASGQRINSAADDAAGPIFKSVRLNNKAAINGGFIVYN